MNRQKNQAQDTPSPTVLQIFLVFFRIGLFTFGGGLAMLAVIRHELVKQRWLSEEEFIENMSVATAVPGVIAVNVALFQGFRFKKIPGAIAGLLGAILPSLSVILIIAHFFLQYFDHPRVQAFFIGAAAAVVGQLAYTALVFGRGTLKDRRGLLLASLGILVIGFFSIHPVFAVVISSVGYFVLKKAGV